MCVCPFGGLTPVGHVDEKPDLSMIFFSSLFLVKDGGVPVNYGFLANYEPLLHNWIILDY